MPRPTGCTRARAALRSAPTPISRSGIPTVTRTIRHADLHDGSDYTPYEGIEVTGWPVTTLVRGQVVVENGVLKADKGVGAFLKRGKSAFVPE